MQKYVVFVALFLALAPLTSCDKKPPPEKPEEPVELTAQQIYDQDFAPIIGQISTWLNNPTPIPDSEIQSITTNTQAKISANRSKENGKTAINFFSGSVEDIMLKARDTDKWKLVNFCCQIYTKLNPGSSTHDKLAERATIMLAKPEVRLTGFFDLEGDLFIFLEVEDSQTKTKEIYKVRETEIFHNGILRLARVIGRQSAVEIEYLPADYLWVIEWDK